MDDKVQGVYDKSGLTFEMLQIRYNSQLGAENHMNTNISLPDAPWYQNRAGDRFFDQKIEEVGGRRRLTRGDA